MAKEPQKNSRNAEKEAPRAASKAAIKAVPFGAEEWVPAIPEQRTQDYPLPISAASVTRAWLGDVSYSHPYNGITGDDVNVATANATGPYAPKNQGNKANMMGLALAVDITEPRGWVGPQEAYAAPATPTLASISPNTRVRAPTTDMVMTLTGTNFMPSSQITIAGNPERTTYVSATSLTTIIRGDVFTGVDPSIPVQVWNADKASVTRPFSIT